MNNLLEVKLSFQTESNKKAGFEKNLGDNDSAVSVERVEGLIRNLRGIKRYYETSEKYVKNLLISAHYTKTIAKSARIQELLKPTGKTPNDIVVGAKFSQDHPESLKHVITYYVDPDTVERTIEKLEILKEFIQTRLGGEANRMNFNITEKNSPNIDYAGFGLRKTAIRSLIVDCSVLERFALPEVEAPSDKDGYILTFYNTEISIARLFEKLNLDSYIYWYAPYGGNTIYASKALFEALMESVPYLISMVSADISMMAKEGFFNAEELPKIEIPDPVAEPTIGVIDTLFDEAVYFSKWVENIDDLSLGETSDSNISREHGTQVTSIIVDGPRLNPWLDDGCGRFRVRHFGVCNEKINVLRLVKKIDKIVAGNPDIHVWNLSLGAEEEVSGNFISFIASAIDEIITKHNVLFVIAGTNDNRNEKPGSLFVGPPADSLNSIVVNSVRKDNTPASYSRKGKILSLFSKPDIAYYGGDEGEMIKVYSPTIGETESYGTSFAAPWISRKAAFLIDVMGLPREVAKALIIDSAAGWGYRKLDAETKNYVGYGVVPIDIEEIVKTQNNEIRFVIYGSSKAYRTYNYEIPVPKDDDKNYPYIARATMCYFPKCARNQGVDYTSRELSLKFGRMNPNGKIIDINENVQGNEGALVDERSARREFMKWENTKFASSVLKKNRPLKSYGEGLWGLSVSSVERLDSKTKEELKFGVVITLREIKGINRIRDFIDACILRGYIVNELDTDARLEIKAKAEEHIDLQ